MLVWDVAFASKFASKLQVTGRSKQSRPHFQEILCRNTLYRPRRERAKQGVVPPCWCPSSAPQSTCCCPGCWPCIPPQGISSQIPSATSHPSTPSLLQAFAVVPGFALCSPGLHPYCSSSLSSPGLERPGEMLTWDRMLTSLHHTPGKGPFSLWWRRDTPNDLCYQSPQAAFASLSSRLTAKFTFAEPLSSFYRFFDSLRVFLCYSGAIQLMASQHCHYKPELFRCLLLSFKNWLYAEIWQTKCQPRRKFYFLPILYSKKKKMTPLWPP